MQDPVNAKIQLWLVELEHFPQQLGKLFSALLGFELLSGVTHDFRSNIDLFVEYCCSIGISHLPRQLRFGQRPVLSVCRGRLQQ